MRDIINIIGRAFINGHWMLVDIVRLLISVVDREGTVAKKLRLISCGCSGSCQSIFPFRP